MLMDLRLEEETAMPVRLRISFRHLLRPLVVIPPARLLPATCLDRLARVQLRRVIVRV